MFNARQVQILLLLWDQDCNGDYLAKKVNSSRRTIIRDINSINDELKKSETAIITSKGKYNLEIFDYSKFQSLIVQFENQDRNILYYLLVNEHLSLDDLMSKTLMSKNDVINSIERINTGNAESMQIISRPGQGYSLNLTFGNRVDLLAYLILIIPKEVNDGFIQSNYPENLREYITDNQMKAQLTALSLLKDISYNDFYLQKQEILNSISYSQILQHVESVSDNFSIKLSKRSLSEKITLHLKRYNLFPTFISNLLLKQINDLKLKEPFAFEMAKKLKKELQKTSRHILVNCDFLALYIIDCMETKSMIKPVKILMFTSQRAIAYINENSITDSIKRIDLSSIFNKAEFDKRLKMDDYDIVIINGLSDSLKNYHPDLVFDGLIDDSTMSLLKKMVSDNYFYKNIEQMFPESNYLSVSNKSNNYFRTLNKVLTLLKSQNLIDDEMVKKIYSREEEGNQLIINHVAIPHAVNDTNSSKIFVINLNEPLKLNGTEIHLMILVIVNDLNEDYKQLFNHLYKILKTDNFEEVSHNQTYESILDFFKSS